MARKLRKDHSEDKQMTATDAKKLFAAVDQIANFASRDSGFPLHSPVKRRIITPDDLEKSARAKISKPEHEDRFARSELTMKKFGLLPRGFDLKNFLVKAERKDIAASYDDETKSISLLNTIPFEEQQAVLAHELTHALQDQNYDLRNWMKPTENSGDMSAARRAVVEGQATIVYMDYFLARVGRTVEDTPGVVYRMEDPSVKYAVDSELMHAAPIILRESGAFPYRDGLFFEAELLQAGGKKLAFPGVFAHPPRTTHEVMQPHAYLDREKISPVPMPNAQLVLGNAYELYDSGSIGELDVKALIWQLATRSLAEDLSKSWRGGTYAAFRKKSDGTSASTADVKLLYVSRWESEEAAHRFAKFYEAAVGHRYHTATPAPALECISSACPISASVITTEEGPVTINVWKDNTVLISESFDQQAAARLVNAASDVAQKHATIYQPQQELGTRFYGLPAFRALQQRVGAEILFRSALQAAAN